MPPRTSLGDVFKTNFCVTSPVTRRESAPGGHGVWVREGRLLTRRSLRGNHCFHSIRRGREPGAMGQALLGFRESFFSFFHSSALRGRRAGSKHHVVKGLLQLEGLGWSPRIPSWGPRLGPGQARLIGDTA